VLLQLINTFGFSQNSVLKKEVLEIINPIYAKIISKNDTVLIMKNEINKKKLLGSLKLLRIDTIKIDSIIVYQEVGNKRMFFTQPQYGKRIMKYRVKSDNNSKTQFEYVEKEKTFVKKYPQVLKIEHWKLEYNRDTIMVQTKREVERIVNIPAQYTWSFDTIWIPKEEQELSLTRLAKYEIVDEMVAVAPKIERWIKETPKIHKNDCCYSGIDEECMGIWALEEIPIKVITIQKVVASSNTPCGEVKPKKIEYKVFPKKVLKTPASTTIERFPPIFEQKIIRSAPLNAKKYKEEVLHIQAIELIYIYEK
jgi:hypothetical protein